MDIHRLIRFSSTVMTPTLISLPLNLNNKVHVPLPEKRLDSLLNLEQVRCRFCYDVDHPENAFLPAVLMGMVVMVVIVVMYMIAVVVSMFECVHVRAIMIFHLTKPESWHRISNNASQIT